MVLKDKKSCFICGEKAGIFTRIKIDDGFLCGDCVKRCSEHLDDYDTKTADEIRSHLDYREKNKQSKILKSFSPTISFGDYEILKIDPKNQTWVLSTSKRYYEENPDVFYLSQVTGCTVIEKKEILSQPSTNADRDLSKTDKKTDRIRKKILPSSKHKPEYGYWFYVSISVHHPSFSKIVMRVNKFIIRSKNPEDYLQYKNQAESICDTFLQLCKKSNKTL